VARGVEYRKSADSAQTKPITFSYIYSDVREAGLIAFYDYDNATDGPRGFDVLA